MENVAPKPEPLPFLCPFCSAPYTLKMSEDWDVSEWCGDGKIQTMTIYDIQSIIHSHNNISELLDWVARAIPWLKAHVLDLEDSRVMCSDVIQELKQLLGEINL